MANDTNTTTSPDYDLSPEALRVNYAMADAALKAIEAAFMAYPDAELLLSDMRTAWDAVHDARSSAEALLFNIHGIRL